MRVAFVLCLLFVLPAGAPESLTASLTVRGRVEPRVRVVRTSSGWAAVSNAKLPFPVKILTSNPRGYTVVTVIAE